jgi:methionyl aminopeptidase
MSIHLYSKKDIENLREGGLILSRTLGELAARVHPGVTTAELDALAEKLIRDVGGEPSFKGYGGGGGIKPFPGTVCTSLNHEVVHGMPVPSRTLKEGDLIKLDIGARYKGLCTDMAVSVPVGAVSRQALKLMATTRESLFAGVDVVKPGRKIVEIGRAVQRVVERDGFSVVRALVGHGVGKKVHEEPPVPNYDDPDMPKTALRSGMVIAIEPMVNAGTWDVTLARDGWTFATADRKLSAHFEMTIAVTDDGYEILTPLPI